MWTHFWDMHSGGGLKLDWAHIFIEAPERTAKKVFYNRFGRNPQNVSCSCCGDDYSISEDKSLGQLTGFHRGCHFDKAKDKYVEKKDRSKYAYRPFVKLAAYKKQADVKIITASEIKAAEKRGRIPTTGWVYVG